MTKTADARHGRQRRASPAERARPSECVSFPSEQHSRTRTPTGEATSRGAGCSRHRARTSGRRRTAIPFRVAKALPTEVVPREPSPVLGFRQAASGPRRDGRRLFFCWLEKKGEPYGNRRGVGGAARAHLGRNRRGGHVGGARGGARGRAGQEGRRSRGICAPWASCPKRSARALARRPTRFATAVEAALEARKAALDARRARWRRMDAEAVDVTLPGRAQQMGTRHLINRITDEISEIFLGLGYSSGRGPRGGDRVLQLQRR